MKTNHSLSIGTLSGTLLSVVSNISSADMLRTAILAAVGAAASFIVSFVLRLITTKEKRKAKK